MSDQRTQSSTDHLADGQNVFHDRYSLISFIGRGGMGVVWLAQDTHHKNTRVVLKFAPDQLSSDAPTLELFSEEVEIARRLTHPNIVRTHNFEKGDGLAAIVMEYVDGADLRTHQRKASRQMPCFTVDALRGWLAQTIAGLHYAHEEAGFVHRDLKPANLLLSPDPRHPSKSRIQISDFGLAVPLALSMSRINTRWGQIAKAGTNAYMSPQQMEGLPPSFSDDIYSLGVTIYELLTGAKPYGSSQSRSKLPPLMATHRQEITQRRLDSRGEELDEVPATWEETVRACLAETPSDRPGSVKELAAALGLEIPALGLLGVAQPSLPQAPPPRPHASPPAKLVDEPLAVTPSAVGTSEAVPVLKEKPSRVPPGGSFFNHVVVKRDFINQQINERSDPQRPED